MPANPPPNRPPPHYDELIRFARVVRQLRQVQKSSGKGYKDSPSHDKASDLEKQVDMHLNLILGPIP